MTDIQNVNVPKICLLLKTETLKLEIIREKSLVSDCNTLAYRNGKNIDLKVRPRLEVMISAL